MAKRLSWVQGKEKTSLDAFLVEYPPSKTWNPAGGDGWIWVRSNRIREVEGGGSSKSLQDAQKVLDGLVERYKEIDENPKIPKVKSKTSGPSKKMCRESEAKKTERALCDIGKAWPSGKWLFFERAGYVDAVFAKLARSVTDGPLSKLPNAKCHTIKAATADPQPGSSNNRGKEQTWLICLYFDVVWNADHAKEVLECVVKEHGQMPNSVKADLYTAIGLDSNHPSKLRSTLYRPAEIFNDDLLKEWQAEYRNQMKRKADGADYNGGDKENKKRVVTSNYAVPVRPEDYWAASPDDQDGFEEQTEKDHTNKADVKEETVGKEAIKEESKQEAIKAESKQEAIKAESKQEAIKAESKQEAISVIDSDSDTEEEEIISLTVPPPKTKTSSSPVKAAAEQGQTKETSPARSTPSSLSKDTTNKQEPSSPIKHTTITPIMIKKRDRFGRSDF